MTRVLRIKSGWEMEVRTGIGEYIAYLWHSRGETIVTKG